MYGYAASSASATTLTPFQQPQQNTGSGSSARQAAAAGPLSTLASLIAIFLAAPADLASVGAVVPGHRRGGTAGLDNRCGGGGEADGVHRPAHCGRCRGGPVHAGGCGEHVHSGGNRADVRPDRDRASYRRGAWDHQHGPPDCALGH